MSVLRDNLQECIKAFQQLLDEYPDDEKLVEAAKKQWPDEDHICRDLVIACQEGLIIRLGSENGGPNPDDDDNILTGKR